MDFSVHCLCFLSWCRSKPFKIAGYLLKKQRSLAVRNWSCFLCKSQNNQRGQMTRVISAVTALLFFFMTSAAFDVKEIVPGREVAAEIGDKLVLHCNATGCPSPAFSWRTQLDHPLEGTVSHQGSRSVLTIDPVSFGNANEYLCNAACGGENRQRTVNIHIFSFSNDPVIEISSPLVLGRQARVTCRIQNVYPSDKLDVYLKKEEDLMSAHDVIEDSNTTPLETLSMISTFTPTEADIGKKITCMASLSVEEMEVRRRQTVHILNVNYGPRKTHITASPGTSLLEDGELMLHCLTESNPPARTVWKKQLANETLQDIVENQTLSIPNIQFNDSGVYICEVTNEVTNETEKRTVTVSVQGAPRLPEFSILPSARVYEGERVTLQCSVESNPAARIVIRRQSASKDVILDSRAGIVHIPSVTPDDAGSYECEVENAFGRKKAAGTLSVESVPTTATTLTSPPESVTAVEDFDTKSATYKTPPLDNENRNVTETEDFSMKSTTYKAETPENEYKAGIPGTNNSVAPTEGSFTSYRVSRNDTTTSAEGVFGAVTNGTEEIEIIIVKTEDPDVVTSVIVGVSSLATVAGPVAAMLVYICWKSKINRSYSLVDSLKPPV